MKRELFKTILCPIDFSKESRHALQYAALLTRRSEGRLIALFVEDPLLDAASAGTGLATTTRAQLRRFVERAVSSFGLHGRTVAFQTTVGAPHREILAAARRHRCDLIVMGAHGITGTAKLMLGSTTERVLRTAPIPVLALPPIDGAPALSRSWPAKPALNPVELGRQAHHDVAQASEAAAALGTVLTLVHVIPPGSRSRLLNARARLHRLTTDGEFQTIVSGHVMAGKPAEQIAAVAEETDADLVILTRRRGKGLFAPASGSISYQLLCSARTPVLALPSRRRPQTHHVSDVHSRRAG